MKLKQSLSRKIPKKLISLVPSSFDVVGSIAIFNDFPKELVKHQKLIANNLIKLNPSIKSVYKKSSKYSGRLRLPKLTFISGLRNKETVHVESGIRLKLNVEKCYFSPRSSNERLRINKLVKKSESVLVLFSGVGPFTCLVAKKAKEVYAVELNKIAHDYAFENLKLNKLKNVVLVKGDVKKVLPKLTKKFNRIIMPLPKTADKYLFLAKKSLKPKGTVHLYMFASENDFSKIKSNYKKKFKSVKLVKAGKFSPSIYRVCLDLNN